MTIQTVGNLVEEIFSHFRPCDYKTNIKISSSSSKSLLTNPTYYANDDTD